MFSVHDAIAQWCSNREGTDHSLTRECNHTDRNPCQKLKSMELAESDFADYLLNLEDYEERLARGEIQW
jgi:hypothetical protein